VRRRGRTQAEAAAIERKRVGIADKSLSCPFGDHYGGRGCHHDAGTSVSFRPHLIPVPASREPISLLAVERAISELRRGRAVAVRGGNGEGSLILAAEGVTGEILAETAAQSQGGPRLAMTARRAAVLGLGSAIGKVVVLTVAGGLDAATVTALADPLSPIPAPSACSLSLAEAAAHSAETAAVMLAKTARLLPAAVVYPVGDPSADDLAAWAERHRCLLVDAGDVFQYQQTTARTLRPVAEARVPLLGAEDARIIAFRPRDGGIEHIVLRIGAPEPPEPVLTRLHSECFTGDLLGSLRCDCGDQLRGAIREIAAAGGGLLLYLAQEGRGIGLVNKLRAYEVQDRGFDTLDANEQLGFDADERLYLPAAHMLRQLGFVRVRLLTNNPAKVAGLERFGITVVERVPHSFPSNPHSERYLRTKQARSGHLF
jgi:GTP cyclohydrolase II